MSSEEPRLAGELLAAREGIPVDLTGVPYRMQGFRLRARSRTTPVQPGTVIDGVGGLGWVPWTLILGASTSRRSDLRNNLGPNQYTGSMTVQLSGLLADGFVYLRRFSLGPFRSMLLDVSAFRDLSVVVIKSTINGADCVANVTNHPINSKPLEWALLDEGYSGAGRYLVPPGARYLVPHVGDVGLQWSMDGAALYPELGGAIPGTLTDVKGTYVHTTAGNFGATWRVYL